MLAGWPPRRSLSLPRSPIPASVVRNPRMSLATRLIILLVVPFTVCVAGFGLNTVRLRQALMLSEAEREIRNEAMSLQPTFDAVLREQSHVEPSRLADEIASAADRILGVLLFDPHGQLVGASRT